jgi:hypothetical protein
MLLIPLDRHNLANDTAYLVLLPLDVDKAECQTLQDLVLLGTVPKLEGNQAYLLGAQ